MGLLIGRSGTNNSPLPGYSAYYEKTLLVCDTKKMIYGSKLIDDDERKKISGLKIRA